MRKSFTLIELLIVLVIIGILTTLAIPSLKKYKDKAKFAENQTMVTAFADSAWRYYTEVGAFPANAGGAPPSNLDTTIPSATKYFQYVYVSSVNTPPVAGNNVMMYGVRVDLAQQPSGSVAGYTISYMYGNTLNSPGTQPMSAGWYKYYGKVISNGGGSATANQGGGWN